MRKRGSIPAFALVALGASSVQAQQTAFIDATQSVGLGGINSTRLGVADLDGDGRPDAVLRETRAGESDRYRVFLNQPGKDGKGVSLVEREGHGLPAPRAGDCLVFADLDNDGHCDAVFVRYLDVNAETYTPPPEPSRTCWLKGRGDGTFGPATVFDAAPPATSACVAVGDLNADGVLDVVIGNWYTRYGASNEAFTNTVLMGSLVDGVPRFEAADLGIEKPGFDEATDSGGRPTYGVLIAHLTGGERPDILEMSYGRRWNRLIAFSGGSYADLAPATGFDGDDIRHGRYPEWLKERAKTDPRFDRPDEKPYRSNGNTFDAAVGDIDLDGDFDVFLSEITHGWAGESSDRSRFLVNGLTLEGGERGRFTSPASLSVDRIPADPTIRNWNQGDLFCELADFDHDGRLDLLLSSGDYPDNQRLRLFRQQSGGTFEDVTSWCGLDHDGSAQIALADLDLDGDMDILAGQSFNRLNAAQIAGRTPSMKVYLNQAVERRGEKGPGSITLLLEGDPTRGVSADALGTLVRVWADTDGDPATPAAVLLRQAIGAGGHAGKQSEILIHVGLGAAAMADRIEVRWPGLEPTVMERVAPGRHDVRLPKDSKLESHRPVSR